MFREKGNSQAFHMDPGQQEKTLGPRPLSAPIWHATKEGEGKYRRRPEVPGTGEDSGDLL